MRPWLRWGVACGALLVLTACGGGGSGALTQPDDGFTYPPVPTPATGRTNAGTVITYPPPPAALPGGPSYDANPALDLTGYRYAHAVGAQGQGVVVAVVDGGVGPHPLLEGAVSPGLDVTGDALPGYGGDGRIDLDGHGTAVAGLIAARGAARTPSMVGVAPQALVMPVRVTSAVSPDGTDPRMVSRAVRSALDQPVPTASGPASPRIINLSLAAAAPSAPLRDVVEAVRGKGALLVVAAGNDGMPSPDWPAAYAPQAGGHVIAVGAVDATGAMPVWSNRAGAAKDHYLVAPGVELLTTVPSALLPPSAQGLAYASGTSFSTPVVAGAAAAVWGLWPYLTAPEVSGILLDTARDLGAPGPDEVYGRGLLDLEAALKPVGATVLPRADGERAPAVVAADGVLAQALRAHAQPVMVFDRYRRHFAVALGQLVASAPQRSGLSLPWGQLWASGTVSDGLRYAGAWQADAQGRLHWQGGWRAQAGDWSLAWWEGVSPAAGQDGAGLAAHLPGWAQVAHGWLAQDGPARGVVGRHRTGPWEVSLGQIHSRAVGVAQVDRQLALGYRDGPWRVAAHATVSDRVWWRGDPGATVQWGVAVSRQTPAGEWMAAWSMTRARQTLTAWPGDLRLDLQGVALGWQTTDAWRSGDRLALGVNRPLSLWRGQAVLTLPTGVDMTTGQPRFETVALPLRQDAPWRLEAAWSAPLRRGAMLSAAAVLPVRGAGAEVVLRYQRPF